MVKYRSKLLVLMLLLVATADSQIAQIPGSSAATGLSGQVVDSYGQGISGARIWIIDSTGQAKETASNATGGYSMTLAPGSYTITAELSGYSFTSATVLVQTSLLSAAPRIVGYWAGPAAQAAVSPPRLRAVRAGLLCHRHRHRMGSGKGDGSDRGRRSLCLPERRWLEDGICHRRAGQLPA